ncbi:GNAT family N-acetyltransferase [Falsiroseomonas sp.]|uniref:GNAT family N-acetyltransferase n=1 Tax=Falsiroseomonas sp. TaxID=2870721 RepID=UPI00356A3BEB
MIVAFLAFQYADPWRRRLGMAERIGGALCDHAGLVARRGFSIEPATLLGLCGIGTLFNDHLSGGQAAFGLAATETRAGHLIDLAGGAAAYFARLREVNKAFLADTERRMRRLEKEFGAASFTVQDRPDWSAVQPLLEAKRGQYARTGVSDALGNPAALALLRALLEADTADCRPVLTTLSAGGRMLAGHLGLLHAGCLSYWFPVYDPAAQKVSPGRLLLWRTIEAADRLGIRLIDRGEGDSQAKRDFSTEVQSFGRVAWQARGWRGMLARTAQAVAWRLGG